MVADGGERIGWGGGYEAKLKGQKGGVERRHHVEEAEEGVEDGGGGGGGRVFN